MLAGLQGVDSHLRMQPTGHADADRVNIRPAQQVAVIRVRRRAIFLCKTLSAVRTDIGNSHETSFVKLCHTTGHGVGRLCRSR